MISDEELYRQYLSGDETGLNELMRKYGDPLILYINGYLHDIHEAEDLMIEVFSYLFTKKPHIRDGGFRAYLYKAARHMALRHKGRRRLLFCLDDLSKEPEGEITGTDTGDKTFYAKWTRNTTPIIPGTTINYIVEHYKTDGSGYTLAETEHSAGEIGDTVTAMPKAYDGFTYNASISIVSGTLKKIGSSADIVTLKLYYDVNTYTVSLDTNGGTIADGKEITGYTYGTGAVLPTANDMTREEYRFDGWYADSSFSGSPVTEITGTDTGDKTFYAKWTRNTTPVTPGNTNRESADSGSDEKADREETAPAVKNTPSYVIHTVQAGDSLWAISRKYGCPVAVIVAANSDLIKNPNRIYAGWQLRIPLPGTGSTPDAVLPENQKRDIYVVRKGDTLWAIARKCGCSVAEIISLNRELIRNPARIFSGWELKVPQK